jgi:hypothetical protein
MKKLLLLFSLFLCFSANSQDVEANNAIKMGYNFVTVSQNVVFDNTMRAGGTLALSAQAMDGGGRAPGDPFVIRMVFYNSNNAILNTAQLSNTLVYGATTPTTYTTTTTNCGGSCANVAYVKVEFYGKDGGYWAGNYGPHIINPSLSFNGGPNILYNPQFGVYGTNGYAQGWTSSNGWQNCQLYSGAQTCVINNNAPVNGGNYSATGGTSSGTAGGYTATPPPPSYSASITSNQQNQVDAARARQTYKNEVNIQQIGSYNEIEVIQSGTYHLVDVNLLGNNNTIGITQLGIKNYSKVNVSGDGNNTNTYQSNPGGNALGHFSGITVVGNTNTIGVSQTGQGEKISFIEVSGSSNSITNNQMGLGTKYADIKTNGNGHIVLVDQKDGGAHGARIELTNNGGASNINVLQQGNTNQTYSIQQSCATLGGCLVNITQQ